MSRQWKPERKAFLDMADRAKVVMERTGRCEGYFDTLTWMLDPAARGPDQDACPGCYLYPDCPCIKLDMARRLNGKE